ncbi:MAG: DNA alkylation repair protein [Bacteroidales bacterium]|jgi:3-methyladenine DNA glycosylase AlkD|nr:DNA alkylation repair protein [Bacteroidales bacterium]
MTVQTVIDHLKYLSNEYAPKLMQETFIPNEESDTKDDIFWGIEMLDVKHVAKDYWRISLDNIKKLIKSPVHEVRLCGFLMLVEQYKRLSQEEKGIIVDLYLSNTKYINSWDLVDSTCYRILGKYLVDKSRDILYQLARSGNVWEQRIAIITTKMFIRNYDFVDAMALLEILIDSPHDVVHRAMGLILREIAKRDQVIMINFVKTHYTNLARVTIRYAIEKLPEDYRQNILKGKFE